MICICIRVRVYDTHTYIGASQVVLMVKNLPANAG